MCEEELDNRRDKTRKECSERGIAIVPYGGSWWLVGDGVDCVVNDLAWVTRQQMEPVPVVAR